VVSRSFWPATRGGAERFIARVAGEAAAMGHEVCVVTGSPVAGKGYRCVINPRPSLRARLLPGSFAFDHAAAEAAARLGVEAVVVNAYWSSLTPYFLRRLGYAGRVAMLVHDVGFLDTMRGPGGAVRRAALRLSAQAADAVIVPTEGVARRLVEGVGVEPGKVRVLGFEGVDAPMARLHVDNEWFDVVQVARFTESKGHLDLVEAARLLAPRLRRLRVLIAGGVTDPAYYRRVVLAAERLNQQLGRRVVEVLGEVDDTGSLYRVADVCVAASRGNEGYGLVVEECMGYGKPVVASDLFAELGVVDEEVAYIYPRGDPRALAERLLEVAENPDAAAEKALRGLERVRGHTWRRVAEKILEALA